VSTLVFQVYAEPASGASGSYTGLDQKLQSASADAAALGGSCSETDFFATTADDPDDSAFGEWRKSSQSLSSQHFSDFSGWDIFRSMLPWTLLTQEPVAMGILRSMAVMSQQQGAFPRWPLANHEVRFPANDTKM
jgi:hypothetical protein